MRGYFCLQPNRIGNDEFVGGGTDVGLSGVYFPLPQQDPEEGDIPSDDSWGFCDDAPKGRPLAEAVASNVMCLFLKKMDDNRGSVWGKYPLALRASWS